MGMFLYGLKNIYRRKLRSFIAVMLISLPFFSVLLMAALQKGIDDQIEYIKRNMGNVIQVNPKGAFGTLNIAGGLNRPLSDRIVDRLKIIEHVRNVTPYLTAIEPIAGYYMTLHIGVKIGARKRLGSHGEVGYPKIILGRDFVESDDGQDVAILGKEYARLVGIDPETFSDRTYFEKEVLRPGPGLVKEGLRSIGGKPFRVVGIFESGYRYGDHQMFLPYETFKKHYRVDNTVSSVYVTVDTVENLELVVEEIGKKLGDRVDVVTQKEGARFVSRALGTIERISRVWIYLSIVLMILILLFSMLLAVDERHREMGILKALGAGTYELAKQILAESAILSVLGGVTAAALFKLLASSIGRSFFTSVFYVYLPGQYAQSLFENLPVQYALSGWVFLLLLVVSLLTSALGTFYALSRARNLSPIQTIGAL